MKKKLLYVVALVGLIAGLVYAGVIVPKPTGLPGNKGTSTK